MVLTPGDPLPLWAGGPLDRVSIRFRVNNPLLSEKLGARVGRQAVHIIFDNLGAHKPQAVSDFLARHPNVRIHYTPTHSSWLNQIEIWFSKIQRDIIARGIFTSLKDLDKKIMRYIRLYNETATPIKWSYQDASNRIKSTSEINETVH